MPDILTAQQAKNLGNNENQDKNRLK